MRDSGVEPELTELCRHEHARLVGLLALYVGDRAIAEDLAQEALVRLHQHWPRVRSLASPHAWVSTVALNLARSWWRRRYAEQRANRRVGTGHDEQPRAEPEDVLAIRAAVAALPPRQRSALVLRYYAGLSVEETATALGCAMGTVKSLTHSAINSLRLALSDADEIDDVDDLDDMIELEEIPRA